MDYHKTKDGKKILISEMDLEHLKNTINWIERKAKRGIVIVDGGGTTAEDMWYDEYILTGPEALNHLNYHLYTSELLKRLTNGTNKIK